MAATCQLHAGAVTPPGQEGAGVVVDNIAGSKHDFIAFFMVDEHHVEEPMAVACADSQMAIRIVFLKELAVNGTIFERGRGYLESAFTVSPNQGLSV